MVHMASAADFYEDDEPLEEIEAAFESGVKRLTKRPSHAEPVAFSLNQRLTVQGTSPASTTVAAVVTRTGR